MIPLFAIILISAGGYVNTSLYTFHRFGAYSVTDFYLDGGMSRYGLKLGLERRYDDFGVRNFAFNIDSVFNRYELNVGEKNYHINGPLGTTLNLWGISLRNQNHDFFLGRTEDQQTLITPTFRDNKYTLGYRLQKSLSYRIPAEFYIIRKSDQPNSSDVLSNNSFGTNIKVNFSEKVLFSSQFITTLSDLGVGGALAMEASFSGQRYGGHTYLRNVFSNYVTPSNFLTDKGNWFRTTLYQKPIDWISFGQDIAYSSIYDLGVGLSTVIEKSPYPSLGYGINIAPQSISQNISTSYQYKKFIAACGYTWSKNDNSLGLRMNQAIANHQFWTSIQASKNIIFQFGSMLSLTPSLKLRNYLTVTRQTGHTTRALGTDVAVRLPHNLNLHSTYELINDDGQYQHFLSLGLANSMVFDEIGFGFISGKVFMDINNNGFYDNEDEPVPEIEVILDNSRKAKTNEVGDYSFSFIKKGEHKISLNLGCMPAEIGLEKSRYTISTAFLKKTQADFSLEELGSIEGIIFFDENNNGEKDVDERGVPNAVIKVNGSLTTTEVNGKYRIANLGSGTYILEVRLLPPETMLATSEVIYIHLNPGEKFANRPLGIVKKERPVNKKVFGE